MLPRVGAARGAERVLPLLGAAVGAERVLRDGAGRADDLLGVGDTRVAPLRDEGAVRAPARAEGAERVGADRAEGDVRDDRPDEAEGAGRTVRLGVAPADGCARPAPDRPDGATAAPRDDVPADGVLPPRTRSEGRAVPTRPPCRAPADGVARVEGLLGDEADGRLGARVLPGATARSEGRRAVIGPTPLLGAATRPPAATPGAAVPLRRVAVRPVAVRAGSL